MSESPFRVDFSPGFAWIAERASEPEGWISNVKGRAIFGPLSVPFLFLFQNLYRYCVNSLTLPVSYVSFLTIPVKAETAMHGGFDIYRDTLVLIQVIVRKFWG